MVDHARSTWRVSIRRACRALPVERSTYHYRSRRAGQAQLSERIKQIAASRVRYGYRRIHVLLRPEGWRVNVKRVCRLYASWVCNCAIKRPSVGSRPSCEDRRAGLRTNEIWAMDFVHDQLATGTKLRVLTIASVGAALVLSRRRRRRGAGKNRARGRLIAKARILRRQRLHPLDQAASARLTTDRLRLIASLPVVRVSMSAETILE
jgi:putative transposase